MADSLHGAPTRASVASAEAAGERRDRLARLQEASPLYAQLLEQNPGWIEWLERDENLRTTFRYGALMSEWRRFAAESGAPLHETAAYLGQLRRWRRLMSLRIAYRSVNGLADEATSVSELTRLGEYCIRECLFLAEKEVFERFGQPWDDAAQQPARFCILALGKLGGQELNFSSDVDLVFVYEGDGYCRRGGVPGAVANVEAYTRLAEIASRHLSAQTPDGFLFRVDARLRPEGAAGPLVRSLPAMENYYAIAGQTWERLAWLKARPVAGDLALGAELLESLHSFRYPRHPPPSLLAEIAAMKQRTEREVVGAKALEDDVKSGPGGIREIEFFVQSFQLLHAGRYPFLQTHSTQTALEQLVRYRLVAEDEADTLLRAYWFLRQVEHRIQMRDEGQSHRLPSDSAARAAIAHGLGFPSVAAFSSRLTETRDAVRRLYAGLFSAHATGQRELDEWWTFFTTDRVPAVVASRIQQWLGNSPDAARQVRLFAAGEGPRLVTREQVTRFQHLAESFDRWLPELADPARTLRRLARFAERYSSRSHFFATCAENPDFLRVLALLFDRSTFTHELLCAHPEIFEEVLRPENLRKQKTVETLRAELSEGPRDAQEFSRWLTLYLRAEQVRYAVAEIVGFLDLPGTERALSALADATLATFISRRRELQPLLVVALGKYGGRELSFGSDLDLLFLADEGAADAIEPHVRELLRILRGNDPLGPALDIDARLRPHGDAGRLVVTLPAFMDYHRSSSAQLWERQALTRARVVAGPPALARAWDEIVDRVVYAPGLSSDQLDEIWRMRGRIEHECDVVTPPERAFKTGAGGLVDHEFLVQIYQLREARNQPKLRTANTREGLAALGDLGFIEVQAAKRLGENYEFLKRIELLLRRDENRPVSVLPSELGALAKWLNFPSVESFWEEYAARLADSRRSVQALLFPNSVLP